MKRGAGVGIVHVIQTPDRPGRAPVIRSGDVALDLQEDPRSSVVSGSYHAGRKLRDQISSRRCPRQPPSPTLPPEPTRGCQLRQLGVDEEVIEALGVQRPAERSEQRKAVPLRDIQP